MGNGRDIPINLLGKETVSPAAGKAGRALDKLGDQAEDAAKDARKLDDEVDDLSRDLVKLAAAYAAAGTEAERADIFKAIRGKQGDLRKLMNVRKLMGDVGKDGAEGFSIGFAQRIGPLVARAPLGSSIAAAIAAGAPLISSAVAGAVTLGVSGGVVGGGLLVAAKDSRVQNAAKTLGHEINNSLGASIREAFVPEALAALSHVRREFNEIEPDLERIFSKSARFVEPLTRAGTGAAHSILDGIEAAVDRADPLFAMLEQRIPRIGAAVGQVIDDFSRSAEQSADTLGGLLALVEATLLTTGKTVGLLSEYSSVLGLGPLQMLGDLLGDSSEATDEWANSFRELIGSAQQAETAVKSFAETANETVNANLSAAEANLRYKESLDSAKDSTDKKKKVTREENEALLALARSSNALTESLDAQGRGALEAAAHNQRLRADFVAAAMAAGYSRQKAEELADSYLAIPKNVNTKISADSDQAAKNLRMIRDLIAAIKSKKVVITTQHRTIVTRSEGRNVPIGDGIGGREHGGPVKAGHAYVVGEKRPEIFVPDRDGRIIPSVEKFNAMTGRSNQGAGIDYDRLSRAVARALNGAVFRIDDRTARLVDLYARGG